MGPLVDVDAPRAILLVVHGKVVGRQLLLVVDLCARIKHVFGFDHGAKDECEVEVEHYLKIALAIWRPDQLCSYQVVPVLPPRTL